ncbi:deoxyuridine 5'-triphosphate nucleotidohydrolase [Pectobacterium phage PM1]|uniref:dUTP diphosphatase n=1 Tax=Pectobacterium phage PM1 TaxID=1399915 RepID=X2CSU2_9CAUD|nr:dUTPase [Pectobacterium phage PM1]AGV99248.1 deoxyuridine 5'-triphosphate nucleotidohydrolase [Pectobacterium phage PM1]
MCCKKAPHVNFVLCHPAAQLPSYESRGAACADIRATEQNVVMARDSEIFGTGLKPEVPKDHVMLVFSRSGHGFKNDIRLANCVGVIDSDYRGEIKVKLTNDGEEDYWVNAGDRIAQIMILPCPQATFEVQENLTSTARGEAGYGSTGVK